jgi:uncharacterized protein YndB with AHSA1/START domain
MTNQTSITAEPGSPLVSIVRELDAPLDLVFRAYTEPELLIQWLGPRELAMTVEEYDVRDGGRWRYTHHDAVGNAYGFHGVFHGPQTTERMVQTFEFDGAPGHVALAWVVFEDLGGRTRVHTQQVSQSVEDRDAMIAGGMEAGLTAGFERLDELFLRLTQPVH